MKELSLNVLDITMNSVKAKATLINIHITEDDELITVYYGKDVAEADAQALTDELADLYDDCDVEMQMGGQPLYYYLISVE